MSEGPAAPAGRHLHVLADRNGNIIAAAALDTHTSSHPTNVRLRITPTHDQRLVVVPPEAHALETQADFQRLVNEFHVPHGAQALVRKPATQDPRTAT